MVWFVLWVSWLVLHATGVRLVWVVQVHGCVFLRFLLSLLTFRTFWFEVAFWTIKQHCTENRLCYFMWIKYVSWYCASYVRMFYYANFSILSSVTLYYVMNFCVVLHVYLATLYMHFPELCLKSCIKNLTFFSTSLVWETRKAIVSQNLWTRLFMCSYTKCLRIMLLNISIKYLLNYFCT